MSWLVTLREQQSRDGPAAPSATAYMPAAKTAFGMPAKAPDAFLAKLSQAEACDRAGAKTASPRAMRGRTTPSRQHAVCAARERPGAAITQATPPS